MPCNWVAVWNETIDDKYSPSWIVVDVRDEWIQVASYVMKTPGLEPALGQRLLAHLARISQQISPPDSPAHPHAPLPGPIPTGLHPESPPGGSFSVFPLAHPTLAREYSITAQFQVYRNNPLADRSASSASFRAEVSGERSDDDSGSQHGRMLNIPTKPSNHLKSEDIEEASGDPSGDPSNDSSGDPSSDPTPGSSSNCLVVESNIVHVASGDDGKDAGMDPMWRPWWRRRETSRVETCDAIINPSISVSTCLSSRLRCVCLCLALHHRPVAFVQQPHVFHSLLLGTPSFAYRVNTARVHNVQFRLW